MEQKKKEVSLQSSASKLGKTVTQIVTGTTGIKKTIRGVITDTIEQGQFTKFRTKDGRLVFVNDSNVFCIEVFPESE